MKAKTKQNKMTTKTSHRQMSVYVNSYCDLKYFPVLTLEISGYTYNMFHFAMFSYSAIKRNFIWVFI